MTRGQFLKWVLKQNLSTDQIQMVGVLFAAYGEGKAKEFAMDCQKPKVYEQLELFSERS